jgi:hypothetical protein
MWNSVRLVIRRCHSPQFSNTSTHISSLLPKVLVEASGPELIPLLPTIVNVAPAALPLLASAVSVPPFAFSVIGLGLLAVAATAVTAIPDDSIANVALQTIVVGTAGAGAVAAFAGGAILGQLTK